MMDVSRLIQIRSQRRRESQMSRNVVKCRDLSLRTEKVQNKPNADVKNCQSIACVQLLLHRAAGQTRDELLLEGEEQDGWRNDRHQRPGKEDAVVLRVLADVLIEHHGQRQLGLGL